MKWQDTPESSHISAIAYGYSDHVLFIEFKKKTIYRYHPVSEPVFKEFQRAPSKGVFFHRRIKKQCHCDKLVGATRNQLQNYQLEFQW